MTQKKKDKLINLAVHESSDPNVISSRQNEDISRETQESNDYLPDDKNPDVHLDEPNLIDQQITIANLSAG